MSFLIIDANKALELNSVMEPQLKKFDPAKLKKKAEKKLKRIRNY